MPRSANTMWPEAPVPNDSGDVAVNGG
jgi:hypothetical protein